MSSSDSKDEYADDFADGRVETQSSAAASSLPASALPGGSTPGIFGVPPQSAAFDPSRFSGARGLSAEDVREISSWVSAFVPQRVELFPAMRPFLPDFIPAPGDIDEFIKPPHPDGRDDDWGLRRLDEPSLLQSDPTVLDLQLRALSKRSGLEPVTVRALEHAEKNPKEVSVGSAITLPRREYARQMT